MTDAIPINGKPDEPAGPSVLHRIAIVAYDNGSLGVEGVAPGPVGAAIALGLIELGHDALKEAMTRRPGRIITPELVPPPNLGRLS
jgi:hypothetical protein